MPGGKSSTGQHGRLTSSKRTDLRSQKGRLAEPSTNLSKPDKLRSHTAWSKGFNCSNRWIDGNLRTSDTSGLQRRKTSPHLPDELWESVICHLCRRDIASLSSVCRRLNWICIPHIWQHAQLHIRSNGNSSLSELASTVSRRTEIGEEIQRLTIASLGPKSSASHAFHSEDSILEAMRSHSPGISSDPALLRTWSDAVARHDTDAVLALVLACLPSLKELSFQYADLDPSHSKCVAQFARLPFTRLHLPMLQHLRIHHRTCNAAFVVALLNSSPPNLSSISLTGDYADPTDYSLYGDEITPSLSTCLARFSPFLRSLELHTRATNHRDLEHYRTSIPKPLDLPSFSRLINLRISTSDLLREDPRAISFSELPRLALLLPPNIAYLHIIDPVDYSAGAHMVRLFLEELVAQGSSRKFASLLSIVLEGQYIQTMCLTLAAECNPPLHFISLMNYVATYGGSHHTVDPILDCPPWPIPTAVRPPRERIAVETGSLTGHSWEEEAFKDHDEDVEETEEHDDDAEDEENVPDMQFVDMLDHYARDMRVMDWLSDHFDHIYRLEDKILNIPDELQHMVLP